MKKIAGRFGAFVCAWALLVAAAPARGQAAPQTNPSSPAVSGPPKLEDATPIKLRLQQTLSSADAQVNDRVEFDVLEEVKVGDLLVIPKGSIAWGTVTEAQAKRRMARGGKLNVNIDAVRLADGEKAALRGVKDTKGGGHLGAMTGAIVVTGLLVWPAAPFFLFMHGKDITIPKGTEITAFINGDFPIDPAKFAGAPPSPSPGQLAAGISTPATAQPPSAPARPALCGVVVKSTPDGADISVDGKYVGSTPSTLKLSSGDHVIAVAKAGFQAWQRTMTLSAGTDITIDATLTKAQ